MNGKICLVTGAISGIGKAVAQGLAERGATVVLVARDQAKGEAAVAAIQAASHNDQVSFLTADLASQSSIRRLAETFTETYAHLHVLINNAAVFKSSRILSPDGIELTFATNHLAYFLLTNLLLDVLKQSAPASIFNVTAPSTVKLNFEELQGERRFSPANAFGASKMANLLFTFALARRLEGSGVIANAYHPGVVRSTNLMQDAPAPMRLLSRILSVTATTPERAVEGLIQLAATNAAGTSGQLFHHEKAIVASDYAYDQQIQERLWSESERLVGLTQAN